MTPKETQTPPAALFRDRIVALERVSAAELKRNPKNWRVHGQQQRAALEGVLGEVGFAGAAVAFHNEDGELELIDGHLRADVADEAEVPVLVTDLSREEADKILASYDVLGLMAGTDSEALASLIADMEFDSPDLEVLLEQLVRDADAALPDDDDDENGTKSKLDADVIPEMELRADEHYDAIIVVATSRQDWNRLVALFDLQKVRKPRTRKIGLNRVVNAKRVIELVGGSAVLPAELATDMVIDAALSGEANGGTV